MTACIAASDDETRARKNSLRTMVKVHVIVNIVNTETLCRIADTSKSGNGSGDSSMDMIHRNFGRSI